MTLISICGNICSECPRYIATQADDFDKLIAIAELWYRLGFRDKIMNPEEMKCEGCYKEKLCAHDLNKCEYLGEKSNCGECNYFPCEKINAVFKKTNKVIEKCKDKCSENEFKDLERAFFMKKQILSEINEIGTKRWLEIENNIK